MKRIPQNIIKFCKRISLSLGLLSLVANAQIYKSTDENGVVTFSDVPPTAGSDVKSTVVKPSVTNSMRGLDPGVSSPEASPTDEPAALTASIASPLNNAAIPMGAGIFDVTAELGAPLADDELLALNLDDEMAHNPQTSAVWSLAYVIRGPHTLQVRRLSLAEEAISQSERIEVFVLRPSVLRAAPR